MPVPVAEARTQMAPPSYGFRDVRFSLGAEILRSAPRQIENTAQRYASVRRRRSCATRSRVKTAANMCGIGKSFT